MWLKCVLTKAYLTAFPPQAMLAMAGMAQASAKVRPGVAGAMQRPTTLRALQPCTSAVRPAALCPAAQQPCNK